MVVQHEGKKINIENVTINGLPFSIFAEQLARKVAKAILHEDVAIKPKFGSATKASKIFNVTSTTIRNWSDQGCFKKYSTESGSALYCYEESQLPTSLDVSMSHAHCSVD